MIAACDTFRSGAVEQLKTHCGRLGIPLYERGYEKDPAKVSSLLLGSKFPRLLPPVSGLGPETGRSELLYHQTGESIPRVNTNTVC